TMASPGLAVAPAWKWAQLKLEDQTRVIGDADAEVADLRNAIEAANRDLVALSEGKLNQVQRELFEAHATLLDDEEILNDAVALIREGEDALTAWRNVIEERAKKI